MNKSCIYVTNSSEEGLLNVGETIEYIRSRKNISIKEICGNQLSRQTYYRIVHNDLDTSVSNFLFILKQLNVELDEFFFIKNNFQKERINQDLILLRAFFEKQEKKKIFLLKNKYERLENKALKEVHIHNLIAVYLLMLEGKNCEDHKKVLVNYLINVETWTHYECILFNNCMFIFNTEIIDIILSKVAANFDSYSSLRQYGNESFRMYANVVLLFIEKMDFEKACKYFTVLQNISLSEDALFEKNSLLFITGLLELLHCVEGGIQKCNTAIQILKYLNCQTTATMFENYFHTTLNRVS